MSRRDGFAKVERNKAGMERTQLFIQLTFLRNYQQSERRGFACYAFVVAHLPSVPLSGRENLLNGISTLNTISTECSGFTWNWSSSSVE